MYNIQKPGTFIDFNKLLKILNKITQLMKLRKNMLQQ